MDYSSTDHLMLLQKITVPKLDISDLVYTNSDI